MPVSRSRRQSLHIARVQPEVEAWSHTHTTRIHGPSGGADCCRSALVHSPTLTTLAPGLGAYALYFYY